MVKQHYRWDFIGLSTDSKPTPSTSEKVVDGSTFYCSDTSKLYVFYKDTWYERKPLGGGGGSYTAGTGINITDDTISVDTTTIQEKLTAGSNVTISDNTISATDTTYSNFTGTDGTAAGVAGLVPAPATTDADKFLKADGTWDTAGQSTLYDSTGDHTDGAMTQKATTKLVYPNSNQTDRVQIGSSSNASSSLAIAIGASAVAGQAGVAVGNHAVAFDRSVALGDYSKNTRTGEVFVGCVSNAHGYNNSYKRVIGGVYDGQNVDDAVTVGQVNATIDAINTALSTNISHIGA